MMFRILPLGVALVVGETAAAQEDWLEAPAPRARLAAIAGADEDGGRLRGLNADLPFAGHGRLYLRLERGEFDGGQRSRHIGIGLGGDPYADTVVRLNVRAHGQADHAEFRDVEVELTQYAGPWDVRLRGLGGQVELHYVEEAAFPFTPERAGVRELERFGLGLGVGWQTGPVYWSADASGYGYSDDPAELGGESRMPLLGSRTLRNVATVPQRELAAAASVLLGDFDLQVGYQRSVSATDDSRFDVVPLGVGYGAETGAQVALHVDVPVEDGALFGQLIVGVRW